MDKNKELLDQIETLLNQGDDKEEMLTFLAVRNSDNVFELFSLIKWYYLGFLHSKYSDVSEHQSDFVNTCQKYQTSEIACNREFFDPFKALLSDEINF